MKKFKIKVSGEGDVSSLLQSSTRLKSDVVTKMLHYGAVKLKVGGKGSFKRIRDPRYRLRKDDLLEAVYDPKVLALAPFTSAQCLYDSPHYGVWLKPANIMSQGTDAGDQTSLMYAVEMTGKTPFLVHRLDRETQGLVLVAYNSKATHLLSELFHHNKIKKIYHALVKVHGFLENQGVIEFPLDQQEAKTSYKVLDRSQDKALLELEIHTGRLHQIRRHLDLIEAPVMGDPKYGKGNKNKDGLALASISLEFIDPWSGQKQLLEHKDYKFYLKH